MKKNRLVLMALAILLGVGSAIGVTAKNESSGSRRIIYRWFPTDASGNIIAGPAFDGTLGQAQAYYGCSGNITRCAVATAGGTPIQNPPYIYKNVASR